MFEELFEPVIQSIRLLEYTHQLEVLGMWLMAVEIHASMLGSGGETGGIIPFSGGYIVEFVFFNGVIFISTIDVGRP
jgi:hypothetical protein